MPWIQIKPTNTGGGKPKGPPIAKCYPDGQLTLSHAAVDLLGHPAKILVSFEPDLMRIRLTPTTPDHRGGFALSGGGNAQARISLRQAIKQHPQLAGDYLAAKVAGGIELRKQED
jgi:hypothetical protein